MLISELESMDCSHIRTASDYDDLISVQELDPYVLR